MAQEADAEPHEVLLRTIRIARGGVVGIQSKLVEIDPEEEPRDLRHVAVRVRRED